MDKQKANTPQNNFNLLWQIFDERYCFFEEKNINWDSIYIDYNYKLQDYLDDPPTSPGLYSLFSYMLTEEFCDGHVCISDGTQSNTCNKWHSPYPDNFNLGFVTHYLQHRRAKVLNNGMSLAPISESVGYIYCPSFSEKINRYDLDKALAMFSECRGVIIDVRGNGGGLVSEAYTLASRFAREKTHVGYVRYKTGKGHNDFSDYFHRYVEPEGTNPFHGKVVVIANRRVYSAANLFVSIMKSLPQVRIMGDYTGGGGGVPMTAELYNGWTVELSINPIFDVDKKSIEPGIAPHQLLMLDKSKDTQTDNIIEAAKEWIMQ